MAGSPRLALGIAVGLLAASVGALYTALWLAWRRDPTQLSQRWCIWLAISLLARTPCGLLMVGALQLPPPSHAAVFPLSAMSVKGMLLLAWAFNEKIQRRKLLGIAIVWTGLLLSGLDAASFSTRTALGDAMFIAASNW